MATAKTLRSKTTNSFQTTFEKRISLEIRSSGSRRKSYFSDKPTPLDFENFIPWVCSEWQVPEMVTVIRMAQDRFSKFGRRGSSGKSKSSRSLKPKEEDEPANKDYSTSTTVVTSTSADSVVPIKAIYNSRSHLAEIVIDSCVTPLHRKVIQAISLCIPFHSFLTKLVISRNGLNHILVHEISKFLPHSNLTDVCLDDTYVPQGNYYEILDYSSNLKHLSLNRCKINDKMCKEIAMRIDLGGPAEKSLAILSLSTNLITDVGAKYFGDVLRKNRHLLYLNLQGNRIGDLGLNYLIKHLQQFPLTYEEIIDKRLRRLRYLRERNEIYEQCAKSITRLQNKESSLISTFDRRSSSLSTKTRFKKSPRKSAQQEAADKSQLPSIDLADKMTIEILGDFIDPFDERSCVIKDGYNYSNGNFKFCSLNVAYNNLEFVSLLRILDVLRYQCQITKPIQQTGLMRIVLEGNNLPNCCPELGDIEMYLKKATFYQDAHTSMKRRNSGLHATRRR